jgi:DNA repair exonuclease SbcCD ATPase subunit
MRKQNKKLLAELQARTKSTSVTNDRDTRDQEIDNLKKQLQDAEENCNIYMIEADEMRKQNKKLLAELQAQPKSTDAPLFTSSNIAAGDKPPHYIEQLRLAQSSLMEHNRKINQLLGQIDIVKETEEMQQQLLSEKELLAEQVEELKMELAQKDKEIHNVRQKEQLTSEMTSMLDSTYNEFNVLQDKIRKLESQVNSSKRINMEYEDLKEGYDKANRDFEEQRMKYHNLASENQQLTAKLEEAEDLFKEANFQRQQLQKRVAYLEELNNDLQAVADANKKLEGQLKRIGELESMLNVVADERDQLARKQMGG